MLFWDSSYENLRWCVQDNPHNVAYTHCNKIVLSLVWVETELKQYYYFTFLCIVLFDSAFVFFFESHLIFYIVLLNQSMNTFYSGRINALVAWLLSLLKTGQHKQSGLLSLFFLLDDLYFGSALALQKDRVTGCLKYKSFLRGMRTNSWSMH